MKLLPESTRTKRFRRVLRGQSLAEFVSSLTMLLILVSGLLDLGRLYFAWVSIEDAAGEAALYLSFNPRCRTASSGTGCADPNNALYRIQNGTSALVNLKDATRTTVNITYAPASTPNSTTDIYPNYNLQDVIVVRITYLFPLLSPVVPRIVNGPNLPLTSFATQYITEK